MTEQEAIQLITEELQRAREKHPRWPGDVIHQAAIVNEEAGELVRAALNHVYEGAPFDALEAEAKQVGAMAVRLLMNLNLRMGQNPWQFPEGICK